MLNVRRIVRRGVCTALESTRSADFNIIIIIIINLIVFAYLYNMAI